MVDEEEGKLVTRHRENNRITRFQSLLGYVFQRATRSDFGPLLPLRLRAQSHGSVSVARVRLHPNESIPTSLIPILKQTGSAATSRIYIGFYDVFRTLIPLPQHRTPRDWSNVHWIFLPLIPLMFMAYLVRRRDTFVMRVLLLPATIYLLLYSAYGYVSLSILGARGRLMILAGFLGSNRGSRGTTGG